MSSANAASKIRLMRTMLLFSICIMAIKFAAWLLTHSNAILTDALESIINVTAGAFALFSIIYASRPRDEGHPYGHGKIEYVSAGFEGGLILLAGLSINGKAIYGMFHPQEIHKIDLGALMAAAAGAANFIMGRILVRRGKKHNSALMIADGKHLISDTVSSVGLVVGLLIMYFTKLDWLDNILALVFGCVIIYMGWKLMRESLGSLLDSADHEKLDQLAATLNKHRRPNWVDMHNLRALKYGSYLHVDAHITLPWYLSLVDAHEEVTAVEKVIRDEMGEEVEFFIHADPCLPTSCSICPLDNCPKRQAERVKKLEWTLENMLPDRKHTAG